MTREQIIREWRESTEEAISALSDWLSCLREWEAAGGEHNKGDFDAAFDVLYKAGLGDWADVNQAGGGLDRLAAAVRGEALPEPEPITEDALLKAIFGGSKEVTQ